MNTGPPPLELGQVVDPYARRALEQIRLRWPRPTSAAVTSTGFVALPRAPTAADGTDGAMYLDTSNGRFYGPKVGGAWPGTPLGILVRDATTYAELSSGS